MYIIKVDVGFNECVIWCVEFFEWCDMIWINDCIIILYIDFYECGFVYSVESWNGFEMVGGFYGVFLGGVFFGESMFLI